LDVGLKHELYGLLREQVAQRGTAVLMITHDLMEAVRLADRIVVMTAQPGRVLRAFRVALPQAQRSEVWIYERTAHLMQMPDVRESFGMPPLSPTEEAAAASSPAAIRCGKKGGDEGLLVSTGSCSAADALPRQGGCTV
jgi:NitT/TauT family transport system ATP-binding protein